MNLWQTYLRPQNLTEALDALAHAHPPLAPIAGGTDLLLDLEQGRHPPVQTLIDLTSVAEMTALEVRDGELFIGAAVPVNRIARDPLTLRHAQALTEACALIAGPQVRNVATLGGNVAHALPAADGTIALLALDAQAEIASPLGIRRSPLLSLFLGPGKSAVDTSRELIVGFYIPIPPSHFRTSSCFKRIMRPQGVALPILNCAVWLERQAETISAIRIAVGPAGVIPFRATQAESALCGRPLTEAAFQAALEALLAQAQFRTSPHRASADYRRHLVAGLLQDVLETAWSRT
jgi:carbon-monoxide dehydrogenase medium subunit